jgi:hypothetical protein
VNYCIRPPTAELPHRFFSHLYVFAYIREGQICISRVFTASSAYPNSSGFFSTCSLQELTLIMKTRELKANAPKMVEKHHLTDDSQSSAENNQVKYTTDIKEGRSTNSGK